MPGTPGSGGELRGEMQRAERPPMPETQRESEASKEAPQDASFSVPAEDASSAQAVNAAPARRAPAPPPTKDELRMRVERVLEENLWDVYLAMSKDQRAKFRAAGEIVAAEMRSIIDQAKIKPSEVHSKIDHWLKTIPKVNQWFLLQESKIKTDGVLIIARERNQQVIE